MSDSSARYLALRDHMIERYIRKIVEVCDRQREQYRQFSGIPCCFRGSLEDCLEHGTDEMLSFARTVSEYRDLMNKHHWICEKVEGDPDDDWEVGHLDYDPDCVEWTAISDADHFVRGFPIGEYKPSWMDDLTHKTRIEEMPLLSKWTRETLTNLCCYCFKYHTNEQQRCGWFDNSLSDALYSIIHADHHGRCVIRDEWATTIVEMKKEMMELTGEEDRVLDKFFSLTVFTSFKYQAFCTSTDQETTWNIEYVKQLRPGLCV